MPLVPQKTCSVSRKVVGKFLVHVLVYLSLFAVAPMFLMSAPQISPAKNSAAQPRFAISFDSKLSPTPLDGRVYIVIATKDDPEPRAQILEVEVSSQQVFGADVDALSPGQNAIISDDALGYPAASFRDIPAGDYCVQGVLNIYTTFHRADGVTVKLPMDEGEGQHWDTKPGNFYSKPQHVHIDPAPRPTRDLNQSHGNYSADRGSQRYRMGEARPHSKPALTKFWGQPMYLGAIVVLPEGWQTHPNAHYPLLVEQGHFPHDYTFQTTPPAANLQAASSRARKRNTIFSRIGAQANFRE